MDRNLLHIVRRRQVAIGTCRSVSVPLSQRLCGSNFGARLRRYIKRLRQPRNNFINFANIPLSSWVCVVHTVHTQVFVCVRVSVLILLGRPAIVCLKVFHTPK